MYKNHSPFYNNKINNLNSLFDLKLISLYPKFVLALLQFFIFLKLLWFLNLKYKTVYFYLLYIFIIILTRLDYYDICHNLIVFMDGGGGWDPSGLGNPGSSSGSGSTGGPGGPGGSKQPITVADPSQSGTEKEDRFVVSNFWGCPPLGKPDKVVVVDNQPSWDSPDLMILEDKNGINCYATANYEALWARFYRYRGHMELIEMKTTDQLNINQVQALFKLMDSYNIDRTPACAWRNQNILAVISEKDPNFVIKKEQSVQ